MISQQNIDTVLQDAEQAVDELADNVGRLVQEDDPAADAPHAVLTPKNDIGSGPSPATMKPVSPRLKRLLNLRVSVSVQIAHRKMPLREILKMVPGTILEFSRSVDEELDLTIGRNRIGKGVTVKLNEHFGLRITGIGDVNQRIASMAG